MSGMADSATRYSGQATIVVKYNERTDDYTAKIKGPGGTHVVKNLHLSPHEKRTIAVDGPVAFDGIAHVALSFADHDLFDTGADSGEGGSGWLILRKKPAGMTRESSAIGKRVEIAPSYDLWMRGARYGEIRSEKNGVYAVKMDHPGVKKLAKIRVEDVKFI
jgi:hypothetical protein